MRKGSDRQRQKSVDAWNAKYSVGTKVIVTTDSGDEITTATRSEAQLLSGHAPVIWLEGIASCYALERVRPELA